MVEQGSPGGERKTGAEPTLGPRGGPGGPGNRPGRIFLGGKEKPTTTENSRGVSAGAEWRGGHPRGEGKKDARTQKEEGLRVRKLGVRRKSHQKKWGPLKRTVHLKEFPRVKHQREKKASGLEGKKLFHFN